MRQRTKIEVGSHIWWDGRSWIVVGFQGGNLDLRDDAGNRIRVLLSDIVQEADFKVMSGADEEHQDSTPVYLDTVDPGLLAEAESLERHLLEALTGYQKGSEAHALDHEPWSSPVFVDM